MLHRMDKLQSSLPQQWLVLLMEHFKHKLVLFPLRSLEMLLKLHLLQNLLFLLGQLLPLLLHKQQLHQLPKHNQTHMASIIMDSKVMEGMVNNMVLHTVSSMGVRMDNSSSSNRKRPLGTISSNHTGKTKVKHILNNKLNMDKVKLNKQVMGKIKHHKAITAKTRVNKVLTDKIKTNKIHMGRIKPHNHTAKANREAMDKTIIANKGSSRVSRVVTTKVNNRVVSIISREVMGNKEIKDKVVLRVEINHKVEISHKVATKINIKEIQIAMDKINRTNGILVHQGVMMEVLIGNTEGNKIMGIRTQVTQEVVTTVVAVMVEIVMGVVIIAMATREVVAVEGLIAAKAVVVEDSTEVAEDVVEVISAAEEVDLIVLVIMTVAMVVDVEEWVVLGEE